MADALKQGKCQKIQGGERCLKAGDLPGGSGNEVGIRGVGRIGHPKMETRVGLEAEFLVEKIKALGYVLVSVQSETETTPGV